MHWKLKFALSFEPDWRDSWRPRNFFCNLRVSVCSHRKSSYRRARKSSISKNLYGYQWLQLFPTYHLLFLVVFETALISGRMSFSLSRCWFLSQLSYFCVYLLFWSFEWLSFVFFYRRSSDYIYLVVCCQFCVTLARFNSQKLHRRSVCRYSPDKSFSSTRVLLDQFTSDKSEARRGSGLKVTRPASQQFSQFWTA